MLPVAESTCQLDDVYVYGRYDRLKNNIPFESFIQDRHWENVKNNKSVKILCIFENEPFSTPEFDNILPVLVNKEINPNQVYFILHDDISATNLKNKTQSINYPVNIMSLNLMLKELVKEHKNTNFARAVAVTKKFSALSRSYKPWRINFFLKLNKHNFLKDFIFTCHNINPYQDPPKLISRKDIAADLKKDLTKQDNKFLKKLPYVLQYKDYIRDHYSSSSLYCISKSNIHVVIETLVSSIPADVPFATEKFYKAVLCNRPFIIMSTPHFLKGIKQLGFNSFDPFINEDYDSIENLDERMDAIVEEIKRLSNMPNHKFQNLLKNFEEICNTNYKTLIDLANKNHLPANFNWLKEYSTSTPIWS